MKDEKKAQPRSKLMTTYKIIQIVKNFSDAFQKQQSISVGSRLNKSMSFETTDDS